MKRADSASHNPSGRPGPGQSRINNFFSRQPKQGRLETAQVDVEPTISPDVIAVEVHKNNTPLNTSCTRGGPTISGKIISTDPTSTINV